MKSRIHEIVILDAGLGCRFAPSKVAVVEEGGGHGTAKKGHDHKTEPHKHTEKTKSAEHREVIAEFSVDCQKPLAGSTIRFGFSRIFPKLEVLRIQVLGENRQTGATIRNDKGSVKL